MNTRKLTIAAMWSLLLAGPAVVMGCSSHEKTTVIKEPARREVIVHDHDHHR